MTWYCPRADVPGVHQPAGNMIVHTAHVAPTPFSHQRIAGVRRLSGRVTQPHALSLGDPVVERCKALREEGRRTHGRTALSARRFSALKYALRIVETVPDRVLPVSCMWRISR